MYYLMFRHFQRSILLNDLRIQINEKTHQSFRPPCHRNNIIVEITSGREFLSWEFAWPSRRGVGLEFARFAVCFSGFLWFSDFSSFGCFGGVGCPSFELDPFSNLLFFTVSLFFSANVFGPVVIVVELPVEAVEVELSWLFLWPELIVFCFVEGEMCWIDEGFVEFWDDWLRGLAGGGLLVGDANPPLGGAPFKPLESGSTNTGYLWLALFYPFKVICHSWLIIPSWIPMPNSIWVFIFWRVWGSLHLCFIILIFIPVLPRILGATFRSRARFWFRFSLVHLFDFRKLKLLLS